MAGKESLVYHNFFGFADEAEEEKGNLTRSRISESSKGSEHHLASLDEVDQEVCTRDSSQNASQFEESSTAPVILSGPFSLDFPTLEDIPSEPSLHQKEIASLHSGEKGIYTDNHQKRKKVGHKESSAERLQMDPDLSNSSHSLKVSRTEDRKRGRHHDVLADDLHLTMQPPRLLLGPSNLHASSALKADGLGLVSKKWVSSHVENLSMGVFGSSRSNQKSLHGDNMMINNSRESVVTPLQISPADEGSRTGLKGSRVGNLMNSGSGNPTTLGGSGMLGRSKSHSQTSATESTFLASQQSTPITRQLTIFYGGQAHVFEDVSLDKVEAIMALAGSSGRSWSTMYSPHPKSNASDGFISSFDKERREKAGNSTNTGHGSSHSGHLRLPDTSNQFSSWANDMQNISNQIMKKNTDG